MKKVISKDELKESILCAIELLCNAAGSTLGPSGNNVIISKDLSPYITNDGATIAKAISSENKAINTILEILKEASLKTNEEVGDGTTTTLVLLETLFKEGIKKIDEGINSITLKKELNKVLDKVIEKIKSQKRKPNKSDLLSIAITSSGSKKIGSLANEVFYKMKSRYAIKLDQSKTSKTYYEIKKGYTLDDIDISSLYFNNGDEIVLSNVYVLVIKNNLDDLEIISDIINEGLIKNKNIVIFANDFDNNIQNEVLLYYLQSNKNIFIFKTPDYGARKGMIEDDIACLTNANAKNLNYETAYFNDLGIANKIIIQRNEIIIINDDPLVNKKIDSLKKELRNANDYDKDFIEKRIAKLENGIATIYVGGNTKTEIKEKIMRYEDVLCALETAKKGVIPGEGITLLKISNEFYETNNGDNIMKTVLKSPLKKIVENAGYDYNIIENYILDSKYKCVYNLKTNQLESIEQTSVVDPCEVVIKALKNAVSIATMLLTTKYLIINEEIIISKDII